MHNQVSARFLEEKRPLLHLWVHLAVDENAVVEVALRELTQDFVLGHYALVYGVNELEILICCVLVSEDFVAHFRFLGSVGLESLHEKKVWSA